MIPGWDLNVTWFTEEGLPKKGILAFEFFAGDGMNLLGCQVDKVLRYKLTSLVLVDQRDLTREIEHDHCGMLSLEHQHSVVRKKSSVALSGSESNTPAIAFSEPPTLPRVKLASQSALFGRLSRINNTEDAGAIVPYTVEDANAHLTSTDVKWNYTSTIQRLDVWQMKD